MKKGLVLEGGAMRGLYSAGIFDVLLENGIEFDGLVGVSAGAAFGCNYKSRQPGRAIRYNKRFARDWRYCSFRSLIKTGDMFGGEFCYHYLPEKLDYFDVDAFDNNPMVFYAVCTDVETGQPIYKRLMQHGYECNEWIRASASMPLASRVIDINGIKVLDGGISDSIPLKFFNKQGYNKNIVILTQPDGYEKKKTKLMPLIKYDLREYPKFLEAVTNRHIMYNEQLRYVKEQEANGLALVFRPKQKIAIGHVCHNPEIMQSVYDSGRQDALERLEEVKAFIL